MLRKGQTNMSRWLFLMGALVLIFGVQQAISSPSSSELIVGKRGEIHLGQDMRIQKKLLPRGTYRVRCDYKSNDDHQMVLTPVGFRRKARIPFRKSLRLQCQIRPVERKNRETTAYIDSTTNTLIKIAIRGENVEHWFAQ